MNVTTQVFVLFLVALVGALCRHNGYLTDAVIHSLTQLVINITAPCLILYNMQREFSRELLSGFLITMLLTMVFILLSIAVGWLVYRNRPHGRRAVLANLLGFSNCGFMGYPIILAVNPDWMIYAVAYNTGFAFLSWTVGISILGGREAASLKRAALNPNVVASAAGFALFCLQLRWPPVLSQTLDLLGGLTTPLTMLLIGTRIYGIRTRDLKDADYHTSAVLRLILLPLFVMVITRLLPVSAAVSGTLILLTAMPMGTMVSMQAELYGGDTVFAARASAWSTLLSMLTIPAVAMIL